VKVTIIPRGRALGAAWYLPEERQLTTAEHINDEMAYALGGRAAEDLVFGKVSTGALSDLEKVTKQSYAMVAFFGMSDKVGNVSYYDSTGQTDFNFTKPYSEKTAELIDAEVKRIIVESYNRALSVLKENMKGLTELAELLLEKEVIFSEDLERIFGKRKGELATDQKLALNGSRLSQKAEASVITPSVSSEADSEEVVVADGGEKKKKKSEKKSSEKKNSEGRSKKSPGKAKEKE
jgi:cell division protease FtsH